MKKQKDADKIELEIRGMTCNSCSMHVTKALRTTDGVLEVDLPSWTSGRASVIADKTTDDDELVSAVVKAGYRASIQSRKALEKLPTIDLNEETDLDLLVIGSGGAGMAAAIKAAELGYTPCIVEAGIIGGTCVNIGCVPSKTLISAAKLYHQAGHHNFAGVVTKAEHLDWKTVIRQKDELVRELRQSKYLDVLAAYDDKISLNHGWAEIQPDGIVKISNGQTCKPKKIVIATGTKPKILPLEGIEDVEVLTSTSLMALKRQPKTLLIIGGRAVALELGQMMARFGTKVTILQRSSHVIPDHEPEISESLVDYLRAEGMTIYTNVTPLSIRQENDEKVVIAEVKGKKHQFKAEQVLMAVGRTPNTEGMGLNSVGVKLDNQGFITVDEYLQTSNPLIYAAGDVTHHPKLVYVAAKAGGTAAYNALNGNSLKLDLTVLPEVIFTDPQVTRVGLTEVQAAEQGYTVETTILPMSYVPRALASRDTRGLIKLVKDVSSNRLLGVHLLAPEGGEIIQIATLMIKFGRDFGITVDDLLKTLFPYLVKAEGLKLALQTFEKDVSKLSCCA